MEPRFDVLGLLAAAGPLGLGPGVVQLPMPLVVVSSVVPATFKAAPERLRRRSAYVLRKLSAEI